MFHIYSFVEDEGDLALYEMSLRDSHGRNGPCEDDAEEKCPFVGMLPEESGKENGSPLNFEYRGTIHIPTIDDIDRQIQEAFELGF